jgi:hypothetical protein
VNRLKCKEKESLEEQNLTEIKISTCITALNNLKLVSEPEQNNSIDSSTAEKQVFHNYFNTRFGFCDLNLVSTKSPLSISDRFKSI